MPAPSQSWIETAKWTRAALRRRAILREYTGACTTSPDPGAGLGIDRQGGPGRGGGSVDWSTRRRPETPSSFPDSSPPPSSSSTLPSKASSLGAIPHHGVLHSPLRRHRGLRDLGRGQPPRDAQAARGPRHPARHRHPQRLLLLVLEGQCGQRRLQQRRPRLVQRPVDQRQQLGRWQGMEARPAPRRQVQRYLEQLQCQQL